jgi:hypothetical protein
MGEKLFFLEAAIKYSSELGALAIEHIVKLLASLNATANLDVQHLL